MSTGELRRDTAVLVAGMGGVIAMIGALMTWATVEFNSRFIGVELGDRRYESMRTALEELIEAEGGSAEP